VTLNFTGCLCSTITVISLSPCVAALFLHHHGESTCSRC
jgi:hypothetical protein